MLKVVMYENNNVSDIYSESQIGMFHPLNAL